MKHLLFSTIIVIVIPCFSNAQTQAGQFSTGGSLGFSTNNEEDHSNDGSETSYSFNDLRFTIEPHINYFLTDLFSVGIGLNYSYLQYENKYDSQTNEMFTKNTRTSNKIGGQLRFRKLINISEKWYFFADAIGEYGTENVVVEEDFKQSIYTNYNKYEYRVENIGVTLRPGVLFFLNSKFALETSIGGINYSTFKEIPENDDEGSGSNRQNFSASFSLSSFRLGCMYYF